MHAGPTPTDLHRTTFPRPAANVWTMKELLRSPCHPQLYGVIITPRGEAPAIRRPCYRFHYIGMPAIGVDVATTGSIPHLHCAIIASRGDALAIGGPRYRFHNVELPAVGEGVVTTGGIPYLHGLIATPRSEALAVG